MDSQTLARLEDHLVAVSRSFALGIQALEQPLRERIGLGYLICRIFDTVEDYGEVPAERRAALLQRCADEMFTAGPPRERLIADIHAAFADVPITEGERALLDDMPLVFAEFDALPAAVRQRMQPNVQEMARGMRRFVLQEPARGLAGFDSVGEVVHYCHYVAGVVGTLLTDVFLLHLGGDGDEADARLHGTLHSYADSFGLGLQLTNVLKNIGDDARRNVSFVPRAFLDRLGLELRELVDAPQSVHSRRFVLDLTSLILPFLERAIEYTHAIPLAPQGPAGRGGRSIRHFLVLPVVFALRTLRLGVAQPAFAFHEQKLKISRDVVRELRDEVAAKLDDPAATAALLERERQAVADELAEAYARTPSLRELGRGGGDGPAAAGPARESGPRNLGQVIDLFLLTFEDAKALRERVRAAEYARPTVAEPAGAAQPADVAKAVEHLYRQRVGEHWSAIVEAHAGLNAQVLLLSLGLGNLWDEATHHGLADYIVHHQRLSPEAADHHGSWPIFWGGPGHLDTTLTCYLALQALNRPADAERIAVARAWLTRAAQRANPGVEARFLLALYGLWPWEDVPTIDPLLALIPKEAAFSRYDFAYWIRIALIPMAVLMHTRYRLPIPNVPADALRSLGFRTGERDPKVAEQRKHWAEMTERLSDRLALPRGDLERLALAHCERWIRTHQDEDGAWGGIYPGIAYSVLGLLALGHGLDSPPVRAGVRALENYQASFDDEAAAAADDPQMRREYGRGRVMQSCQSPVWDTAWSLFALERAGVPLLTPANVAALDWLVGEQILIEGDWAARVPLGFGGGWAFQYANAFFPDVDDTAVVLCVLASALRQADEPGAPAWPGRERAASALRIGLRWLLNMQNADGGWAAFERGVDNEMMREIPLNDLDNWLDPSTADVTGRCLMALGRLGFTADDAAVAKALRWLREDQRASGAWWGRWGVNYIYGTWSVLEGQWAVGVPMREDAAVQRAAEWLVRCQNLDGGWGETCDSYPDPSAAGSGQASTPSQTAWALLGLRAAGYGSRSTAAAAGEPRQARIARAIADGRRWLRDAQTAAGTWVEHAYTGTGFPGHFYLRYHLYRHVFPLMALAADE